MNAIKALNDWMLDVLAVPFGGPNNGRDSHRQFFSSKTDIHAGTFETPLVMYYHGFTPESKPQGQPEVIGQAVAGSWEKRADGWWIKVKLNQASELARRVWDAAQKGLARASSGSVMHLVRVTRDGEITNWPVAEVALMDTTNGQRQPANSYAVALPALKMAYQRAGLKLPEIEEDAAAETPEAGAEGGPAGLQSAPAAEKGSSNNNQPLKTGDLTMDEQLNTAVQQAVAAAMKAQLDAQAAEEKRKAEIEAAKAEAVTAAKAEWEAQAAKGRRLPDGSGGTTPVVAKFGDLWKYDNLNPADQAFMVGVLQAAKQGGHSRRGVSEAALKALAIKMIEAKPDDGVAQATVGAMKMLDMPLKANELNQSTLSNYGDEWVSMAYSSQLWEKIRMGAQVLPKLPTVEVPQGAESILIPVDSTAPTFYHVAQASAQAANPGAITRTVTTSKKGTANQTLSVGKIGASVYWTGELEEDSLIPWAGELRRDMENEGTEVMDHVVIDGDTDLTITTNINSIGGTPAATDVYTTFNGMRKLALITNTANSRSAGGAFDVSDFLETVKLMGLAGKNAVKKAGVEFIVDLWTMWKALGLPEVMNKDVFSQPTIENGVLTSIYGYGIVPTANMHRANQDATYGLKANSAGKVDLTTPANNLYGAILSVRYDQWRFGWKRRATMETKREPSADATELVMLMRAGLIYRDTEASAITYYVGV